ncbi:MAG: hypothetical protein R3F30_10970, partial [Planctomycetota bacterium]
ADARWFAEVLGGGLRLTEAQLARERQRVLGEVRNMTGFLPGGVLQWQARERMLDGPAGRTGIGVAAQLGRVTLDELRSTVAATHHAGNVLVVAVGRVHPERDLPFWTELLGGLEARETPEPVAWERPADLADEAPHPNVGAVFGSLAFRAPGARDPDLPAFLVAASLVLQRAQVDRKPRGAQLEAQFFPASYAFLEAPELFLLNLRGEDGQEAAAVREDLEGWLGRLRARNLAEPLLAMPKHSLVWFFLPPELDRAGRRAFSANPRELYRLGLSRGTSLVRGLPADLAARIQAVGPEAVKAALERWFAADKGRFVALVPGRPDKGR